MGKEYVGLHLHTDIGSLMDGVATPEEYAERAADVGMTALACTDHGSLSAHRQFARAVSSKGIKPILGVEAYFTKDRFDQRDKKDRSEPLDLIYNHLILIAKNANGLKNLGRLNEIAWNEGFYKKPRIDYEVLDKYGDDLIVSSACMSGLLNKAIEVDDYANAKETIDWFLGRFGEDFYVEVMPHNVAGMNSALLGLADEFNIPAIVTPDCHHSTKDQKEIQELMLLLNTHAKLQKDVTFAGTAKMDSAMEKFDYLYGDDRRMTFRNFDIHLMSSEEMWDAMAADGVEREDIFDNTLAIADKIEDYDIKENLNLLPVSYKNPNDHIHKIALEGLKRRGLADKPEYVARLDEELDVVKSKNFAPYFIVVRNMLNWAKKQDILVGPGRGSSAGSLLCYALGITEIDPVEHNLLFSRFLDAERDDWPDIDSDLQDDRREEVKDYLVRQYRHVASIATFNAFKDKGVVRDVSRIFYVPLDDVNKVLKSLDTWEEFEFGQSAAWFRQKYPDVVTYGRLLRGRVRSTGIHAAGVVTANTPISSVAPMETRNVPGKKTRMPVVAVDMNEAARIGLIKIDALGLKTLTVISDALKSIEQRHGRKIDLHSIPMDDQNVYRMLSAGHTKGVFQAEATPYTNLLMEMGVSSFDDLVASNALVRPGAMNTIGRDFVDRKNGVQSVKYLHPIMQEFTEETYGTVIYQEQVMLACTKLAGMSTGEANKIRKIIGKKKDVAEFEAYKEKFVEGASKHVDPSDAEKLWHDFEAHAGYSFNKSHAVAYSTVSYWTAWLKYHYPLEFMFSLLKNEKDPNSRAEYLIEIKRLGIKIKLPHINESDMHEKIEGQSIRLGLVAVKYVSDTIAERYIAQRPFESYAQVDEFTFSKGSGVNSRAMASMNSIGALAFPDNPVDTEQVKKNLYDVLNLPEFSHDVPAHYRRYITEASEYESDKTQIMLGVARGIKRGKGWSRIDLLDRSGVAGFFDKQDTEVEAGRSYLMLVSENRLMKAVPADDLRNTSEAIIKFLNYKRLPYSGQEYYVLAFNSRLTKAGKRMATLCLANEDRELATAVVWPNKYGEAFVNIEEGNYHKIDLRYNKSGSLVFNGVVK